MHDWLATLDLTSYDYLILMASPIAGFIGSLVRVLMIRNELEALPGYPSELKPFRWVYVYTRFVWYFSWFVVGAGSGLLIALLFVGALKDGAGSAARVLALALLSGYGAPALWKRQAEAALAVIEARVKAGTSNPSSTVAAQPVTPAAGFQPPLS